MPTLHRVANGETVPVPRLRADSLKQRVTVVITRQESGEVPAFFVRADRREQPSFYRAARRGCQTMIVRDSRPA